MKSSITWRDTIIHPQARVMENPWASGPKMMIALTHIDIITIILFITIRIGNQITMTIINIRKCISRNIGMKREMFMDHFIL